MAPPPPAPPPKTKTRMREGPARRGWSLVHGTTSTAPAAGTTYPLPQRPAQPYPPRGGRQTQPQSPSACAGGDDGGGLGQPRTAGRGAVTRRVGAGRAPPHLTPRHSPAGAPLRRLPLPLTSRHHHPWAACARAIARPASGLVSRGRSGGRPTGLAARGPRRIWCPSAHHPLPRAGSAWRPGPRAVQARGGPGAGSKADRRQPPTALPGLEVTWRHPRSHSKTPLAK